MIFCVVFAQLRPRWRYVPARLFYEEHDWYHLNSVGSGNFGRRVRHIMSCSDGHCDSYFLNGVSWLRNLTVIVLTDI